MRECLAANARVLLELRVAAHVAGQTRSDVDNKQLSGPNAGREAERARLETQLAERDTQMQQCSVKNQQIYGAAKDVGAGRISGDESKPLAR